MTDLDLVIRAPRLISTAGEVGRTVGVKDGTIVAIEPLSSDLTAPQVVELPDDETLLPGVVDSHVHVNDPGRTDWEGFASATKAAAAGGVTTLIDMPLNSIPPTVDVAALEVKRKTAESQAHIDVGFWGGAIPGNVADLRPLYDAGVFGFKCFLLHSGVDEFPPLDPDQLEAAMREIASFDGLMIVHAEDTHAIEHAPTAHGETYTNFSVLAAERGGKPRHRPGDRAGPVDRLPRAYPARLQLGCAADDRDRAARRHRYHGRDLPALLDVRVRGDPGRRNAIQVLPADKGRRQPGAVVARPWRRGDRSCRLRPLAVDGGPEVP